MDNHSNESEEPSPRVELPEEEEEIPIDPVVFKEQLKQKRDKYLQEMREQSEKQE